MADHAVTSAAAAMDQDAMEIDARLARVIEVELAKTKTRVPSTDIINASRLIYSATAATDDFQSNLVACSHANSNVFGVIMRYAIGMRISPNHPHLPGNAIKLA
eukprot:jgi/Tetstr1/444182/TSEL_032076.t1